MPYVYLIRKHFWEKGVFKIGCSNNTSNYDRIKSYGKKAQILGLIEVNDCREVEKNLKLLFNSKFILIEGKEHFKGNEDEIKLEFLKIVYNYQVNIQQNTVLETKVDTDSSGYLCENKIDTDSSADLCENKIDTGNSVDSIDLGETKVDNDSSVDLCETKIDTGNSVDSIDSIDLGETKVDTGSVDLCETKVRQHLGCAIIGCGSHNQIAKALYEKHQFTFVCSSIKNKTWYQLKNNIWKQIEYDVITDYFLSYIENILGKMGKEIWKKMANEEDKADEDSLKTKLKRIGKMYRNCKSAPFKNNVMNEAMEVFYNHKFKTNNIGEGKTY